MDLSHGVWPLILAHTDFDFVSQMYLKSDVEIRTIISKIGTKSFTVSHEAYQDGRLCVKGNAVLVCYDFINQKSKELPDNIKIELEKGGRTFDTPSTSQELNIESV
jgi:acyl-CoA thioester hydrolase